MEMKEVVNEALSKWSAAVEYHTSRRYCEAVKTYCEISDISARMYYNLACAYLKLNHTDFAIQCLCSAIEIDEHLAIAYFQRGTLYLQNKSIEKATVDLETARLLLQGNAYIDYKPLGLHVILYSFQILHNLALAFAYVKQVAEARELLTEALTDADDLQGKSLQTSLERINRYQPSRISVLQISVDKVFTPTKHVTQNLEKQGIVLKAKVVSASDTEDRSPRYWGLKRVRELKDMLKPAKTAFSAVKHFALTILSTDSNEKAANSGMKKSKSMNDLLTEDCSNTVFCPRSPITKHKHIFPIGSPEILPKSSSDFYEKLNFDSNRDTKSPGSDGYLTFARHGKSLSCDVLTAIGTPTDYENDLLADETVQDSFPFDDHALSRDKEQSVHSYINIRSNKKAEPESTIPKHTLSNNIETQSGQSSKFLSDKAETQSSIQTETLVKVRTKTPLPISSSTVNIRDHRVKPDAKKQRPSPPSYPPPPLPPHMIK